MNLWFKKLIAKKMPGFSVRGFELTECKPSLNIVYGRNAAGKSTTAKAIHGLLWPTTAKESDQVSALLELDNKTWEADIKSCETSFKVNGMAEDSPVCPSSELSKCYYLLLKDLAVDEHSELASEIKKQISGGYDLQKISKDLQFDDKQPTRKINPYKALEAAINEMKSATKELQLHASEESRLDDLKKDLQEAENAARRKAVLDAAVKYASNRDDLEQKKRDVECCNPSLQLLKGDERTKLNALKQELSAQQDKLRDAESDKREYSDQMKATDLPEGGVPDTILVALNEREKTLSAEEINLKNKRAELANADDKVAKSRGTIGASVTDEQLNDVTEPGNWKEQAELARKAELHRSQCHALNAFRGWLKSKRTSKETAIPDIDSLNEGISRLHEWLDVGPARPSGGGWLVIVFAVIATILALVGQTLVAAGFMAASAVAAVVALLKRTATSKPPHEEYVKSSLPQPKGWDHQSVLALLKDLRSRLRSAEYDEDIDKRIKEDDDRADKLTEEAEELDRQRDQLRDRLGVAAGMDEPALALLADAIKNWRDAREMQRKAKMDMESAEADYGKIITQINDDAKPYTANNCTDLASASGLIKDIQNRAARYKESAGQILQAEREEKNANDGIAKCESTIRELYNSVKVEPDDEQALYKLIEMREDYLGKVELQQEAQTNKNTSENELRDAAADNIQALQGFSIDDWIATLDIESALEHLMALPKSQLEMERDDHTAQAANRDCINHQITEINTLVKEDKKSKALETALAKVMQTRAVLRKHRDQTYESNVGSVLLNYVEQKSREDDPEVLKHARKIFADITDDRYELRFSRDSFIVRDNMLNEDRELDELSDGTRVQLLLSVRLAFVEYLEKDGGVRLPLLFDETLASTDDHRAPLIAQTILKICKTGRQVFYFTAQQDEVNKLAECAQDSHCEAHVINFDNVVQAAQ
ncbi:MAG: AAA family ATPase [Armatimonadetes bacterium]|nr:AAA family ATPase [Armatimonadota bacterium]